MKNAYDLTIKHRNMKDKDYYVIRKKEREKEKKRNLLLDLIF